MSNTSSPSSLYIGLMSGTSIDSIDAALVDFSQSTPTLISAIEQPIPAALKQQLVDLCQPGDNEINHMGAADRELGLVFADAVETLLIQSKTTAQDIAAIGSHGQTIRHHPNGKHGFSLQIGDPNTISLNTGITTIADFRRKDIAAGGQGAPLAPVFHRALFGNSDTARAIINIGGISNISVLNADGSTTGYDTGPGNGLMDYWIQRHQSQAYDNDGAWAASGTAIPELLNTLLADDYFAQPSPKSTGRELFNPQWLQDKNTEDQYSDCDVQATLLALTCESIAREVEQLINTNEIFICGGGAYNSTLIQALQARLAPRAVSTTDDLGIAPKWVEACGFAWLAKQTLAGLAGNNPSVTGANKQTVLGAIYQ